MKEIELYRQKDILNLFSGKKLSANEIEKRQKSYLFYKDNKNKIYLISGDENLSIIKRFNRDIISKDIVKGKVANGKKEILKGYVRIITRDYGNKLSIYQEMDNMKDGEILVTETTDPDMLPAMKKSLAIITDIGGMLSHAAITSRELEKVCIIDTLYASKVFKTGDLVEVDADKGIVKIIKRGNEK
jgi:phosphoenolpyruvate synthase/pyruvate phosphate dikinase